jgi:hypothetical protein
MRLYCILFIADSPDPGRTMAEIPTLDIPRLPRAPDTGDTFASRLWAAVPATIIGCFHERSSTHRPLTQARVGWTPTALHLAWRVEDRHVLARCSADNQDVCTDSCVECFVAPLPGRGHINVEVNAGGTALVSHVTATDPWVSRMFSAGELARIGRRGSLPSRIDPEITEPCTWEMAVDIPFDLIAASYDTPVGPTGTWRANLFKCADGSSHPHWASWAPIGERLAFHQPDRFGVWRFV